MNDCKFLRTIVIVWLIILTILNSLGTMETLDECLF